MENIALEEAKTRYDRALKMYVIAQEELQTAASALRKQGEFSAPPAAIRFPLYDERVGLTHKIEIGAAPKRFEGYVSTGLYSDGSLGEIWLEAEKEGTFVSGILDSLAIVFSLALQYGVPLSHIADKLKTQRFEPDGYTQNKEISHAHSVTDYIVRWLELKHGKDAKHG